MNSMGIDGRMSADGRLPDSRDDRTRELDACLARLPHEQRTLILSYYGGTTEERIHNRRRLAAQLGIPLNALRIRAHRIRQQLERAMCTLTGEDADAR